MTKKNHKKHHILIGLLIVIFIFVIASFFAMPGVFATNYDTGEVSQKVKVGEEIVTEEPPVVLHFPKPDVVKTIYMTSCVVGTPSFRDDLVELIETTEINSIIIDIKDYTGSISFPPRRENLKQAWNAAECGTSDMGEFIKELHNKGIYVIGRITVFQDPLYTKNHPETAVKRASDGAVWKDHKGLSFVEVGAKSYWDYIVDLSHESYEIGFDELNYDYVRFPSDGNMKDIYYPFSNGTLTADPEDGKVTALQEFFKYLDSKVRPNPEDVDRLYTSADLFGMVTTNSDDLNIGQKLESALPYFDYIAPMVYPSHYPNGFNGYSNPNHYPYEVVEFSMSTAVGKIETLLSSSTTPQKIKDRVHVQQLRPWLQDFDYGGDYGPTEVREQIQATYDAGLTSWMLWAPSNRYTKAALKGAN